MRFSRLEEEPTVRYVLFVSFFNMQRQHCTQIAPLGMWKINVGQYKRISASELREGRVQKKIFFCEIDLKLWLDRPFGLYAY